VTEVRLIDEKNTEGRNSSETVPLNILKFLKVQKECYQFPIIKTAVSKMAHVSIMGMRTAQGRFTSSDYWFNQMYYGTHGPFKRAQAGQAITFENDKVK
jgi:hypothetical protein